MPLSLSDSELQILLDVARPLAPRDRDEFLQTVAAELGRHEVIGPGIVSRVAAQTQRKYFAAPSLHGHNRKYDG